MECFGELMAVLSGSFRRLTGRDVEAAYARLKEAAPKRQRGPIYLVPFQCPFLETLKEGKAELRP